MERYPQKIYAVQETMDQVNCTRLHYAALNGQNSRVVLLTVVDKNKFFTAVWESHTNIAEVLLENGTSIHAINKYSHTLLHLAAWNGHTGMMRLLFRKGIVGLIRAQNQHANTPFHVATLKGDGSVVELLLKKGASIRYWHK